MAVNSELLNRAKQALTGYKTKMKAPDEPTIDDLNKVIGSKNAQAMGGDMATPRTDTEINQTTKEYQKAILDKKYPNANDKPEMSAKNMAEHDEDVDNLIGLLSIFMGGNPFVGGASKAGLMGKPAVIGEEATNLLGGLVKKLGGKTFSPAAVESAIGKSFKSKNVGDLSSRLADDAATARYFEGEDWAMKNGEETLSTLKKAKEEMTPAFERGYGTKNADIRGAQLDEWEKMARAESDDAVKAGIEEEKRFIEGLKKTYGKDWYKKAFSTDANFIN